MRFEEQDLATSGPPAGRYRAMITEVKERRNERGNHLVVLQLEILDGDWTGDLLRDYFVVDGHNPRATRIGRRRLASVFKAAEIAIAANVDIDLISLRDGVVELKVVDGDWHGRRTPKVHSYFVSNLKTNF